MDVTDSSPSLRARIAGSQRLIGSFVKIAGPSPVEILGQAGFDFVVIDQEHGVFDRSATDVALLACKAAGTAGIVRVPSLDSGSILSALDSGAAGILAPHIDSAADARALVSACRYRPGHRGFSGVTRAGGYGSKGMRNHIVDADAAVATIAMIEDPAGVDAIEEIVAVVGLDAVFIGRGDLTVAYGEDSRDAPRIEKAIHKIIDASIRSQVPVWMMAETAKEVETLSAKGASSFIISSDQGLLRTAAREIVSKARDVIIPIVT